LASGEFVALAATEGLRLESFEYNGRVSSREGNYPVFRCVRDDLQELCSKEFKHALGSRT
ncbi:MAG TPA: hypothetical protein VIT23_13385, partial [Terrimicrobiaceae bacterium]